MSEKWIVVRPGDNDYYSPERPVWGLRTSDIKLAKRYADKDEARKIADSVLGHIETAP
jgi:hypothetical protein